MFEVEKKFKLSAEESKRLLTDAEFVSEKTFTDVYYDTADYALTRNDIWLRKRGEQFELKLLMHDPVGDKPTQQYQEIEGEEKIREIFSLPPMKDFLSDITDFGYAAFCECQTTRKKYTKEGFILDIDKVDCGDFLYEVAEIELLVEKKEQMNEAAEKIEKFATKNGLEKKYIHGKVIEYLFQKKPAHFQALVDAGIIRE
ncbi:MAG: CYTH domain-containing protein [Candidatus Moranbacteria bacterium]|nr:CYTH domain-containing protein [Candidatus Moranbacteria bacterium]